MHLGLHLRQESIVIIPLQKVSPMISISRREYIAKVLRPSSAEANLG
jgi:hypothetical protein